MASHGSILIAADNHSNRVVAAGPGDRAGYAVDAAADGPSVVQAAAAHPYSLILLDLNLPGLDCVEVSRCIRGLPAPRGDVPILAIDGTLSEADRDRCMAAGVNGFFTKPLDPLELLDAVAYWVAVADELTWRQGSRPGPAPPLVNRRTLAQLEDDLGDELLPGIMVSIFAESERGLQVLAQRVAGGDAIGAADQAHALKGIAGTFGAMAWSQILQEIEEAGLNGDQGRLVKLMPEAQRRLASTWARLRADYPFMVSGPPWS